MGGVPGSGVWLWIELNRNGSGDYTGADCIHTGPAGLNGAGHQRGDVTWTDSGGKLTITGVALVDAQFPVTVVVPDRYGHYTRGIGQLRPGLCPRPDRRDRASTGRPVRTAHQTAPAAAPLRRSAVGAVPVTRANSWSALQLLPAFAQDEPQLHRCHRIDP